jgi:hypothetical protein
MRVSMLKMIIEAYKKIMFDGLKTQILQTEDMVKW